MCSSYHRSDQTDRHRRWDVAAPPRFASKVPSSGRQLHCWKTLLRVASRIQRINPFLPSVHTTPPAISPPRGRSKSEAENTSTPSHAPFPWRFRHRSQKWKTGSDMNLRSKSRLSPPSTFLGSRHLSIESRYLPPSVAKDSLEEDLRQSQKGEHLDLG